jgi:hypothetical protein
MTLGEKSFTVNNEMRVMDVAPFFDGDFTYVPIRFVAENLGAAVDWDAGSSTATITWAV